jgi:hypothetical protein
VTQLLASCSDFWKMFTGKTDNHFWVTGNCWVLYNCNDVEVARPRTLSTMFLNLDNTTWRICNTIPYIIFVLWASFKPQILNHASHFFLHPFQFLFRYPPFTWHYWARVTENCKQIRQISCKWKPKADPSSIRNEMHRTNISNIYNYTNLQTVSKSFPSITTPTTD